MGKIRLAYQWRNVARRTVVFGQVAKAKSDEPYWFHGDKEGGKLTLGELRRHWPTTSVPYLSYCSN